MSPEQCRGMRLMDHRSDLYSLGVVLFELLTGRVPHHGETFNELMFKIALEDAAKPTDFRSDLDPELSAIIVKALARDADARYQTARDFEQALVEWGEKHGIEDERGSKRTRLRIEVDEEARASFRATTERPAPPSATRTLESASLPADPPLPKVSGTSSELEALVDARTETGDRAMSVSTPAREEDLPPIPQKNPRVWAAAAFLLLGAVGIVALIAGARRMVDAGTSASASAIGSSAKPPAALLDAEPTPLASAAVAMTATTEPPPVAPTGSTSIATATAPGKAPLVATPPVRGPQKPSGSALPPSSSASTTPLAATAVPVGAPADAGPVVDGRRIRTEF